MKCKYCKGTKKIQLLRSIVDCKDCPPEDRRERITVPDLDLGEWFKIIPQPEPYDIED